MNKTKALLTLIFSALGIFGANEYYKPRNIKDLLKWQGIKLASENKSWESMYFENEEELKLMKIENANSLWSWCNERFKQNNLADEKELNVTKKFCSDNPKTIMGRVIREGEDSKVIKKEDLKSFSINYILSDNTQEVLNLIGFHQDLTSRLELVATTHSKWCEKQKRIKIISKEDLGKLSNFKKRCYSRGVKTVSDLLIKQGKKPIYSGEKYKRRFEDGKFEYVEELKTEIKKSLGIGNKKQEIVNLINASEEMKTKERITESELSEEEIIKKYGWILYKSWCESKLKISLITPQLYPEIYKRVSFRCTEEGINN